MYLLIIDDIKITQIKKILTMILSENRFFFTCKKLPFVIKKKLRNYYMSYKKNRLRVYLQKKIIKYFRI